MDFIAITKDNFFSCKYREYLNDGYSWVAVTTDLMTFQKNVLLRSKLTIREYSADGV